MPSHASTASLPDTGLNRSVPKQALGTNQRPGQEKQGKRFDFACSEPAPGGVSCEGDGHCHEEPALDSPAHKPMIPLRGDAETQVTLEPGGTAQ